MHQQRSGGNFFVPTQPFFMEELEREELGGESVSREWVADGELQLQEQLCESVVCKGCEINDRLLIRSNQGSESIVNYQEPENE